MMIIFSIGKIIIKNKIYKYDFYLNQEIMLRTLKVYTKLVTESFVYSTQDGADRLGCLINS